MRLSAFAVTAILILGCGHLAPTAWGGPPRPPDKLPASIYVTGAAFSADAKHIVVGYGLQGGDSHSDRIRDGRVTLALWDVESGKNIWATGTMEDLIPLGFRPGRKEILVRAFWDFRGQSVLQLWDAETGLRLRKLTPDPRPISCAAIAPDGVLALAGDERGNIQVWDIDTGRLLRTFSAERSAVRRIGFSPDGRLALSTHARSGEGACTVNLWDVRTGKLVLSIPRADQSGEHMASSPDGTLAVGSRYDAETRKDSLVLRESATGREIRRFDVWGNLAAFTPDGKQLVVANSSEGRVTVLDVVSGENVWTIGSEKWQGKLTGSVFITPAMNEALSALQVGMPEDANGIALGIWGITSGKRLRTLEPIPPRPRQPPPP
jgi:WD40 repeat protein